MVDYKVMERVEDRQRRKKLSPAYLLLCNNRIRMSAGYYESSDYYQKKKWVAFRMFIYATFDLMNEGDRPFKTKVINTVDDRFEEYIEKILFRADNDWDFYRRTKYNREKLREKIMSYKGKMYWGVYKEAFLVLFPKVFGVHLKKNDFFKVTHYIKLTAFGRKLKFLVDEGFVF